MRHLAVLAALLAATPTVAQTSADYARMGSATWSAFECSSLAGKSGDTKEQERLFLYGYKQGQAFIAGVIDKKAKREDLSKGTPWMMLLLLEGPTPDFMLGRIFAAAQDSAFEGVYKTGAVHHDEATQKSNAKDKYWKQNCQHLGK